MVERHNGFKGSRSEQLSLPEKRLLTNEDVGRMFGDDYKKLVEDKAAEFGIKGLQFFDSPLVHNGSQAMYLAEQFVRDDLILVPVLGENMETSEHSHGHPMVREIYHYIAGESHVRVGNEVHILNHIRPRIEVPLDVVHQVRTLEKPSLTLIIMEDARLVPAGRLHIKTEKQARS